MRAGGRGWRASNKFALRGVPWKTCGIGAETMAYGMTEARDRDAGLVQGILLTCVTTMIIVTIGAALPVLPAIIRAFPQQPHIAELVPLVAVLPFLASALTSLAAGVMGEHVGRRRLMITATAVFALSAIMPIWLNSFVLVLLSRAAAGLAVGVMMTSAVALTGDYYSGAALQRWLGAQGGAGAIANMLVSTASGALGEVSWHYAFLPLFVGVPLFVALIAVPAPQAEAAHKQEAAVRQAQGSQTPWTTWLPVFGLAIIGTALVASPVFELGILLHEKALGTSLLTGLAIAVVAAASAVAAFSIGALRRLAPLSKASLLLGIEGAGTLLIAQAMTLVPLMLGAVMAGLGLGLLGPTLTIWLMERTPDRLRGRAIGIYTTAILLTMFAAPLIARWASVSLHASSTAMKWYGLTDLGMAALLVGSWFKPSKPEMQAAE